VIYIFIFAFGSFYIHRLLRMGPVGDLVLPPMAAVPNRPMSVVEPHIADGLHVPAGE
jgi:cytochrome d ubiquinol oxidase subunit I